MLGEVDGVKRQALLRSIAGDDSDSVLDGRGQGEVSTESESETGKERGRRGDGMLPYKGGMEGEGEGAGNGKREMGEGEKGRKGGEGAKVKYKFTADRPGAGWRASWAGAGEVIRGARGRAPTPWPSLYSAIQRSCTRLQP